MSSYQIGNWGFIKWEGPPPPFVRQHVRSFNKIGQAGISAQLTGIHGDPFEVELSAAFPNQTQAAFADEGYRDLIGSTAELIYNGVNYLFTYQHRYLVTSVMTTSMKAHPLLTGPTYTYYGGWLVKSRWSLIPIT